MVVAKLDIILYYIEGCVCVKVLNSFNNAPLFHDA